MVFLSTDIVVNGYPVTQQIRETMDGDDYNYRSDKLSSKTFVYTLFTQ